MVYGYARMWTDDQSMDAQAHQLTAAGCAAFDGLEPGDLVIVTRLDRLARSTRDLLNTLATIAAREAGFRSLGDAWADARTPHGRLLLTVLGGLAEFERELILVRTGEGRAWAKARGAKMGRKPKLTPHQRSEALARIEAGEAMHGHRAVVQRRPYHDLAARQALTGLRA